MRVRSPFPRPQATRCVKMAAARLLLLCRKTRALPAEVLRLVHDYLFVHVGASCPAWLNQVLEAKLLALPLGVYGSVTVSILASKTVEYDVYRQDEFEYGRTNPPRHVPKRGQPVRVDVRLALTEPICVGCWYLMCHQGGEGLRHGAGMCIADATLSENSEIISRWDLLSQLSEIRSRFDTTEPCGSMEVPTTWRDWRRFVRLWLFGPPARRPMLELQRNPVAGELCRDCGKSSMPATMHPVHMHGEAFCSQQCAEAYMVISCSSCREPLIEGQGLCRACAA